MIAILLKELRAYFGTYYAYVMATGFLIISNFFLWFIDNEWNVFELKDASMLSFFKVAPWILVFLIPAITMRQLTEEKQLNTLNWLKAQPLKPFEIILGKYLSVVVVVLFCLLSTLVYLYSYTTLSIDSTLDVGTIGSGYLGLILLCFLFSAIGLLISALTSNQVLAYVFSLFVCFILYFGLEGLSSYDLLGSADYYIKSIGAKLHYDNFVRGIIDTKNIMYFICLTCICLILSIVSIQSNKPQ